MFAWDQRFWWRCHYSFFKTCRWWVGCRTRYSGLVGVLSETQALEINTHQVEWDQLLFSLGCLNVRGELGDVMHGLEKSWISIKRCLDRFIGCLGLPICICWHQGTSLFEISPEMIRFLKFILDPWMNIFLFNILHPFSFFLYSN